MFAGEGCYAVFSNQTPRGILFILRSLSHRTIRNYNNKSAYLHSKTNIVENTMSTLLAGYILIVLMDIWRHQCILTNILRLLGISLGTLVFCIARHILHSTVYLCFIIMCSFLCSNEQIVVLYSCSFIVQRKESSHLRGCRITTSLAYHSVWRCALLFQLTTIPISCLLGRTTPSWTFELINQRQCQKSGHLHSLRSEAVSGASMWLFYRISFSKQMNYVKSNPIWHPIYRTCYVVLGEVLMFHLSPPSIKKTLHAIV